MSRFNTLTVTMSDTHNLAGGEAYSESAKLEFVSILVTSFVKDQFYRKDDVTIARIVQLLGEGNVDPLFAAKAAIFARDRFGMRSSSHIVAGEIAKIVKGQPWTRPFFCHVAIRPDDVLEILSYYVSRYGKRPLPNAMRDGLGQALMKFDAYQLAKYRGEGKGINLVDAVNLLHPKPTEQNAEAMRLLIKGELHSTETWEAKLTQAGQAENIEGDTKEERKAEAWRDLITSRKIGYFALLRNLRNIMQQAPDVLDVACELLSEERLIHRSRVLPFRFQTALNEIGKEPGPLTRQVLIAINKAVDIAVKNVPTLPGATLVAVDESGSMNGRPIEIASLFAAVLYRSQADVDVIGFANDAKRVALNPQDSTLSTANLIRQANSGGTDFRPIFTTARRKYDRIIILSDMQAWVGALAPVAEYADYRKRTGAEPHIYSWDLQGYGTLQFPEEHVYALAGFSEKVFDLMALLEQDRQALISEVEAISFRE